MIQTDVLIVGGGPGGSSCARRLVENGAACLVLDQRAFPRQKVCAGWIKPEVVKMVGLDPAEYPGSFTTFTSFKISYRGIRLTTQARDHAIRRYEFDHWLVQRCGAPVIEHAVKSIRREGGYYIIDDVYCAKFLVGAGGTHCPVYRTLFKLEGKHDAATLVVAQEEEFQSPYNDARGYLWFAENGLPGYAWYVPKANGWVNVGIGAFEERLKARGDSLKNHWKALVETLDRLGLVRGHTWKPAGHSYYVRQRQGEVRRNNAFLVGDAAGLATLDMGEGIGPAVHSGILAADAILTCGEYRLDAIPRYSISPLLKLALF